LIKHWVGGRSSKLANHFKADYIFEFNIYSYLFNILTVLGMEILTSRKGVKL